MISLDIIRVFQKYHIPHLDGSGHHHCKSGWVQAHCPFCIKQNWTLGYHKTDNYFHCWRCGSMSVWTVLPTLLHTDKPAIGRLLRDFAAGTPQYPSQAPIVRQRRLKPPPGIAPMGPQHRRYLKGRGFDPDELAELWEVQGTGPLSGTWSWRVVYPIYDGAERVVAYQGRAIGRDAGARYKLTEHERCLIEPEAILYGIHAVPGDSVIIVEGATGVWRLGPGTVATLGIGWHHQQANQLRRFKRRFVMFDPEPKAQRRAAKLAAQLSIFPGETELITDLGCQPGELKSEEAKDLVKTLFS